MAANIAAFEAERKIINDAIEVGRKAPREKDPISIISSIEAVRQIEKSQNQLIQFALEDSQVTKGMVGSKLR